MFRPTTPNIVTHAKLENTQKAEECPLSDDKHNDHKPEEGFRVIDRRPFTSEGELRPEVVEQEAREAKLEAQREVAKMPTPASPGPQVVPPVPPPDAPKPSAAFENLVRMLGSNAAMVLGSYTDPRTGQPMIDPEAARELIDMLDALHEKTKGNLAPEEDSLLLDLLGKLKMAFLEVNQAIAAQAAAAPPGKAKSRP